MACTLHIQIDAALKTPEPEVVGPEAPPVKYGWHAALRAVALEFQNNINPALSYMGKEPIAVNPDSELLEGYLGIANTAPTDSESWEYDGLVTVQIENYDFINSRFFGMLPVPPTTFWLIGGKPPQAGTFI
jgi:hypothetical protein